MKLRKGEWLMILGSLVIVAFAIVSGAVVFMQPDRQLYVYEENEQVIRGEAVYRHEGCNACHTIFGNGYAYGPTLDGIGSRRSAEWLHRYLLAPWPGVSKRRYRAVMPAYVKLTDEDRNDLVAYLQAIKAAESDEEVLRP